jgi:hypothetical protein
MHGPLNVKCETSRSNHQCLTYTSLQTFWVTTTHSNRILIWQIQDTGYVPQLPTQNAADALIRLRPPFCWQVVMWTGSFEQRTTAGVFVRHTGRGNVAFVTSIDLPSQFKLLYTALTLLLSTPQNGMLLFDLSHTKDSDDRPLYKPSALISLLVYRSRNSYLS